MRFQIYTPPFLGLIDTSAMDKRDMEEARKRLENARRQHNRRILKVWLYILINLLALAAIFCI